MFISDKEFLFQFGWDAFFENQIINLNLSTLRPARIIGEERNLYRIQLGLEEVHLAVINGKMQFNAHAHARADYPAVGDWVFAETHPNSDRAVIQQILSRKSTLQRKQVGSSADVQILSVNMDYVFVTSSLSDELNYRRLERYIILVWESGCVPVVLLTKTDASILFLDEIILEINQLFPGVNVHCLSKDSFEQADFFAEYLKKGKTAVVVGSSGVGKSTLVNFLIGQNQIKTQDVRGSDSKGRHTTTSRSLFVSRYGGLIIDTPGMRELQLLDHEQGLQNQFSDIEELKQGCRFTDCSHQSEPGCSLLQALDQGHISPERWQSYQKLAAEIEYGKRKQNKALAAKEKKKWKKIHRDVRGQRKILKP